MQVSSELDQPCYSARLLEPFVRLLFERGEIAESAMVSFRRLGTDSRIHVSAVNAMLEAMVTRTGDRLIGLEAVCKTLPGDVGVVDFLMRSASTPRAAIRAAARFMRLLNDVLDVSLAVEQSRAIVQLHSGIAMLPAAEDFVLCGLVRNQVAHWPDDMLSELDVCFRHEAPHDVSPYRAALGPVRLHFRALYTGLSFPDRFLDRPLHGADERLHAFLNEYAEKELETLPRSESVTSRVRSFVAARLAEGDFSLLTVARELKMSPRTLARRLTSEGTSFRSLVDELRKDVCLRSLSGRDIDFTEVARLAGFRENPSFFRAFRRWTRTTPANYRRRHRRIASPIR